MAWWGCSLMWSPRPDGMILFMSQLVCGGLYQWLGIELGLGTGEGIGEGSASG
jgi:hypothetical protein